MTVVVAPKELRIYVFVLNFILHISHSLRYGLIWLHYPNASCLSICCNMMTNIQRVIVIKSELQSLNLCMYTLFSFTLN